MQNADRVISRNELLNEVWGYQNYPATRTVDNHILKLRQKLEKDPSRSIHFRNVHSIGYMFVGDSREHGAGTYPLFSMRTLLRFRG